MGTWWAGPQSAVCGRVFTYESDDNSVEKPIECLKCGEFE